MAQANRWTLKILSLPVFSDAFAQAILQTPIGDLAFISAMNASSASEFASRVCDMSSTFDHEVAQTVCQDSSQLEQFWFLAIASEKLFLESTAFQLGFGLCETRTLQRESSSIAKLRKEAVIRALVSKPTAPSKKRRSSEPESSSSQLLDKENAEKAKWAARLEAIGRRAGSEAKLLTRDDQSDDLSNGELAKLKQLVLISGAPRTMAAHIRSFERMEIWFDFNSIPVYPLTIDKVLKYSLFLDERECGASVRFVVPAVGFKVQNWLQVGWELFLDQDFPERDFWVQELNTRDMFMERPPTYQRSVQWMKFFAGYVVDSLKMNSGSRALSIESVSNLTAHSCRVTLLDAAVHAGRSSEEIGLQANWKDPGPLVLKYTRNRSSVPATMIKQLVRDLSHEKHPIVEDENTMLTDAADDDADGMEFFTKTPAPGTYYDYKFHATALGDPDSLACKKFPLSECSSVGSTLPDISVFCKACARSRPDIVAAFS